MTMDHDITVHERLASLEATQRSHGDRVEGQLATIIQRLDQQNGRLVKTETDVDQLQLDAERTREWKDSRDGRIGELQGWRLKTDLDRAHEAGRQMGRSELRKADLVKLAMVVGGAQGLLGLAAWGAGLF